MLERREDHLRVALAPEGDPLPLEQATDLQEVVDLAVVGDHVTAARGRHGLRARLREVEDGEPPVAERDTIVVLEHDALPVRPAMREGADEPLDRRSIDSRVVELEDAGDSAHCASLAQDTS